MDRTGWLKKALANAAAERSMLEDYRKNRGTEQESPPETPPKPVEKKPEQRQET